MLQLTSLSSYTVCEETGSCSADLNDVCRVVRCGENTALLNTLPTALARFHLIFITLETEREGVREREKKQLFCKKMQLCLHVCVHFIQPVEL